MLFVLCLAFNFLEDVLQPTVPPQNQRATLANQQSGKILANDLDSSLANLVGSKCEAFKFNCKQNKLFPPSPHIKTTYFACFSFPTDLGFGGTPSKK